MPPFVRSVFKDFAILVSGMLFFSGLAPLTLAQHPVPSGNPAAATAHTAAPPAAHAPVFRSPAVYTPIFHAPVSTSRVPVAPSAGVSSLTVIHPPRRPIRPFPPVLVIYEPPFFLGGPFWGWNSCAWASCDLFSSWPLDFSLSSPGPVNYVAPVLPPPVDIYGQERPDLPQLFLKDGTILNVIDYWVVDNQLHFKMIEGDATKPAEHLIPFEALDLQTTVDENTRKGFRFMLRNEPFEEYVRDHPEGPPAGIVPHS